MTEQLLSIFTTIVGIGIVVALAIATLAVIIWAFHVSFLYGVVAIVGSEILPLIIVLLVVLYH